MERQNSEPCNPTANGAYNTGTIYNPKDIYGLGKAGTLSNKQQQKFLAPHGHAPFHLTPGIWRHSILPITSSIVVDNSSVKYVRKEHVDHIQHIPFFHYEKIEQDWAGKWFFGITLDWHYKDGYIKMPMPGYVKNHYSNYSMPHHQQQKILSPHGSTQPMESKLK